MNRPTTTRHCGVLLAACMLSACASVGNVVSMPGVSLRSVQLTELDFSRQTFVLGFDVTNPNPFPLPIKTVQYGVALDGYRFASGETRSPFTVAASSDGEFSISVNLNLLQTAPQLLAIVRDGVRRDIPYELEGQLGVDIPFTKPLYFRNSGEIRLQSGGF